MKRTTLKEFFSQLEQAKTNYTWEIDSDGSIRGDNDKNEYVCPLTAVAHSIHYKFYGVSQFYQANKDCVKLSDEVMDAVTDAADYIFMEKAGRLALRKRLLQILELKELEGIDQLEEIEENA